MILGGIRFGVSGDPTISANQVSPGYGQRVVASIVLINNGGTQARFTLTGIAVLPGTRTKVGTYWADAANTQSALSGTLAPGEQKTVQMYSGPTAWADEVGADYTDHIFTLNFDGQSVEYLVQKAVKLPRRIELAECPTCQVCVACQTCVSGVSAPATCSTCQYCYACQVACYSAQGTCSSCQSCVSCQYCYYQQVTQCSSCQYCYYCQAACYSAQAGCSGCMKCVSCQYCYYKQG